MGNQTLLTPLGIASEAAIRQSLSPLCPQSVRSEGSQRTRRGSYVGLSGPATHSNAWLRGAMKFCTPSPVIHVAISS